MTDRDPALTRAALQAYLDEVFPQMAGRARVETVAAYRLEAVGLVREADLRPGGTVSGPAMFALADWTFYAAVLSMIGREPLTVTTNLSIDFMRKPEPKPMRAEARLLKLGRTLAVGDVTLFSPGVSGPIAHANVTYAIPPRPSEPSSASPDARPAAAGWRADWPRFAAPIETRGLPDKPRPRPPRPLRRGR